MSNGRLDSVQILRGFAALSVMLFHFRWNINLSYPNLGDKLFGWGAIGVDVFFIISGFVITLSAKKLTPGLSAVGFFLKHRARRILPAYFIILLITFLLSGAMSTFHYPEKVSNLISAITFSPIDANHAPFYVDDSGFYGIRWTLNYEVLFYLVMAVCLISKYRWLLLFGVFSLSLIVLPMLTGQSPTLNVGGYQFNSAYLNLMTNPIIWMFLVGVGFGLIYPYTKHLNCQLRLVILVIALVVTGYFVLFTPSLGHGLTMSGWYLSILFIAVVLNDEVITKYTPRFLVTLGEVSFSLYLIHTLMNGGIGKRFEDIGVVDGLPRFVLSCVISIGLAYLSYRFIERPVSLRKQKTVRHEMV
ncbi:Acyltransferase family [Serratia entomophila]|uniref:acyltransferase family protein n=1 Tax=Serratia TaxID=613 RepID=UPI001F4C1044|nr:MULTISPECIES: acyltransferase [Serratia]ULG11205.1 acyltransferase [Serratia entomophila]ULG18157.1 acyltransferase [Serratia proteamaculans]ULG19062.1 acyltransferase [Serratia proteamaculans]CAI1179288.1 Acyltransferase family [Serratia entomophila]CAI2154997.1 Acyltransferase family [Serratia entomophila]